LIPPKDAAAVSSEEEEVEPLAKRGKGWEIKEEEVERSAPSVCRLHSEII